MSQRVDVAFDAIAVVVVVVVVVGVVVVVVVDFVVDVGARTTS